jgi:hypothetical protein
MKPEEIKFIQDAVRFFERPGNFTRALSGLGSGVEVALAKLPQTVKSSALKASRKAIEASLKLAVKTIAPSSEVPEKFSIVEVIERTRVSRNSHSMAAAFSGGVGGVFGPLALAIELPISTSLIMRSIASTASDYGFDLKDPEVLLECLFVFAIGGPSKKDDGMDSSYISSRVAMASLLRNAASAMMELPAKQLLLGVENKSAPAVVRVVAAISEAFGVRVSQKFVAQLAPVVGVVGGAGINLAFANFFGRAAEFHFGIKRLEAMYGSDVVQTIYRDEAKKINKS